MFAFRDFDALSYDVVPAVRSYTVVDPIFGAATFAAVFGSNPRTRLLNRHRGTTVGAGGIEMFDDAGRWPHSTARPTIPEILEGIRPMGDLSRFAIEDLTLEEEVEFFAILETV